MLPSELRHRGILGINCRNTNSLLKSNPRLLYPRVDDKVLTKGLCEAQGVPAPGIYALIERFGDAHRLPDMIGKPQELVIKHARGTGRRILAIVRQNGAGFETATGVVLSLDELRPHVSTILSCLYSLGGRPDRTTVEQRIVSHSRFGHVAIGGTPDVPVILCRSAPVMAMLRLPTRASNGRANLHRGAVGVGVHIAKGQTSGGVCNNRTVTIHPDTGAPIDGIDIPHWVHVLKTAISLNDALGPGYVGVDIVLDAKQGPVLLEANARPGLAVQIANRRGLRFRVEMVNSRPANMLIPEHRLDLVNALANA